jgi:hypothetical protein
MTFNKDFTMRPQRTRLFATIAGLLLALGGFMASPHALAQNPSVTVTVDAQANRHAISPNIYGLSYGSPTMLSDLNVPITRLGGNNASRYNWQLNADNRANDWYYESIADASAVAGERGDTFFSNARSVGAQAMITVPMLDWVAKLGANRNKLASFSIAKYGAQTGSDWQWYPDAGNGVLTSGAYVSGNDPNDANVASSAAFQQGWVQHLVGQWGLASAGGLRYYVLDNEPSIWHSTHRDVHPTGATMDEMKNRMINYASMIKSVDPTALVVGPEEWGWSGYLYSGYDQQYGSLHGWSSLPDRASHGNWDYVPYLLDQMRQYEAANGKRLLDVFSLHYYPQGGEFGDDTSSAMQLRRNRSTRSLWDPNYVDESWIGTQVKLIPRMKAWVNSYYPGTPTAITEYNWGAEGHINGATTQADIYGIFGREGLDMATRWTYPDAASPTYKAMKLYRNYDGNKSAFGDISVSDTTANPDNLSSFAAVRSGDGTLTVMVISKVLSGSTPVTVNLANFSASGPAQVWQLTAANAITRLADAAAGASVSLSVPAQSITLLVIPAGTAVPPAVPAGLTATGQDRQIALSWSASSGAATYNVKRSTTSGGPYTTIKTGATATSYTDTGLTNGTTYYYVVSAVNSAGESANSTQASATPQVSAPSAPTGLKATGAKNKISLSWTQSTSANITKNRVYRSSSSAGPFTLLKEVAAATSTTDTTVASRTTYYYLVTAVNSGGLESPYSNTASAAAK